MRLRKQTSSAESRGFTLAEAILALAILAAALLGLLAVRSHSVAGARRTLLLRSAQRLGADLAAQIEAGVFDEPEVGRVEYGVYIDNRERYRRPGNYNVPRIEYPAYPENQDDPSYPPGLKFEWEITEDSQPAEVIPNNSALSGDDVKKRYNERANRAEERERELSHSDPSTGLSGTGSGSEGDAGKDPLLSAEEEEAEEEKTEEWRTLTVFVRADTAEKPDFLLFEIERRFLWTYPDRIRQAEEDDTESGASGSLGSGSGGGSRAGANLGAGNSGGSK
ncbi:MAG: hypothetical protein IPN34_01135 [Planctomycetes bacterium]|nr:hypothetical protein [Planctomycetota bacterium]